MIIIYKYNIIYNDILYIKNAYLLIIYLLLKLFNSSSAEINRIFFN